jgi:diguanylate cyclase (GGDEF)-like protein
VLAALPWKVNITGKSWTSSSLILALLSVSGLAILGLVFFAAIWAAAASDGAALERQRGLVTGRLQDQVQRVSQEIQLMGAGFASLLMTDPSIAPDDSTTRTVIGKMAPAAAFEKIASTVFGYNAAFLITHEGMLALSADAETARRFKWVRPLLLPMLRDLEGREARSAGQLGSAMEPVRVELMRLEGRPSVAGIVRISPLAAAVALDQAENDAVHLYLVAFRFLDGAALDAISREQGLAGARYARTADQEHHEVAYQIAATTTGEPIGFIIWKPELPGSRVISRLVPVLAGAGIIIAILFFALIRRLRVSLRELSESEHHARHLSVHDVLTGLANRVLFTARLEQCLMSVASRRSQAVVAMIDLDKFKEVNDTYGHGAGDELLRAAAARMSALLLPSDTLARTGGDEFALLLPDLSDAATRHTRICSAIIEEMSKPFQLQGGDLSVRIGCSIGVTIIRDASETTGELFRRADLALYEAKTHGRGQLVEYHPALDHRIEAREKLKRDLRILLQETAPAGEPSHPVEVGALEIFYQGIHRGDREAKLSGAEALVRWRHPTLGLLSPDRFIPIAEEVGLIQQLGEWVMRNAVQAAAGWPADLLLAVNVSPSQIRHAEFECKVVALLKESGLAPSRLELELTEAALFNIDDRSQATLGRLRALGIKIALDDFGTGFSSLSHLVQLNIDRIKIDRSFVKLLGMQAEGAAIVSAILGLSHTLGKATTAEGVETEGQRDFLVSAGCTDLQGFLLSRPVPRAAFEAQIPLVQPDHLSHHTGVRML